MGCAAQAVVMQSTLYRVGAAWFATLTVETCGRIPSWRKSSRGRVWESALESDVGAHDVPDLFDVVKDVVVRQAELPHAVGHHDGCTSGDALCTVHEHPASVGASGIDEVKALVQHTEDVFLWYVCTRSLLVRRCVWQPAPGA